MIENLKRVREPAAWVVVAVAVVGLVLAGVRFALALTVGDTTFSAAAQDLALQTMNLTLVAVIVAQPWVDAEETLDSEQEWQSLEDFLGPEVPIPAALGEVEVRGDVTTRERARV